MADAGPQFPDPCCDGYDRGYARALRDAIDVIDNSDLPNAVAAEVIQRLQEIPR